VTWPARRLRGGPGGATAEEFWALREVEFEVAPGEVVGIIGRNGAGKSTLLKVLSRITRPTTGRVRIHGRLGSLLEVGTGFHPELSGRENVYLNGAILGMSRGEIARKFDDIVAFAEVERFLDTPVKRYSSGMYVRLAFAVAAFLEPDILVVDEVLAVGDVAFQRKCLGKMGEVSRHGRTILFVSHQMAAVQNLCDRVVLLDRGRVLANDRTEAVIERYLRDAAELAAMPLADRPDRQGTGALRFLSVALRDGRGAPVGALGCGSDCAIALRYENRAGQALRDVRLDLAIDNALGQRLAWLSTELRGERLPAVPAGRGEVEVLLSRLPLTPGRYAFTVYCVVGGAVADWVQNAGYFDVEAGDFYGTGKLPPPMGGDFLLEHSFRLARAEEAP
jgi:lipopolysaccharide transport system ATP-binding protein